MTTKLNPILALISFALAGLAAYGFFAANEGDTYRFLITIGSGVSLLITLGSMFALSLPNRSLMVNIKVVSGLFFIALLIEHIVFSFIGIRLSLYIVITGVLVVLHILACYIIIRANK